MDISHFGNNSNSETHLEKIETNGSTCDTFRTKMYGKLVFVKRLKQQYSANIRYREALRKEFEIGFGLEHPNLAKYIMFKDNDIYIEYIDGETLAQRLKRDSNYFNNRRNCDKFISQLLSAAEYLHSHQVLHLDIKPDNILITRINNDVKLVDLGFCKSDSYTETTGFTARYASPEQLKGEGCDERSDIYSIGRIIELLPSKHIYKKIIERCTAQNREERYNSVKEIKLPQNRQRGLYILFAAVFSILCVLFYKWSTNESIVNEEKALRYERLTEPTELPPGSNITEENDGEGSHSTTGCEENDSTTNESCNTVITSAGEEKTETDSQPATQTIPEAVTFELTPEAQKDIEAAINSGKNLQRSLEQEFELFKPKLNGYLEDIITFLNDSSNLTLYPTYIQYDYKYKELWRAALRNIENDEWTYSRYKSISNPYSRYKAALLDSIEAKYHENCNKLP